MNTTSKSATRQLGIWMCVALVIGNIIGSGIFLLPASLAPYGLNSIWAWLLSCSGAIVLALVFAALGRALPEAGGPYDYTRMAFGELAGFVVIWVYWISLWVGNAAIATGGVSYLSNLVPWIAGQPGASALVTVAFVIVLTAVNVYGARSAGALQLLTTVLKLVPLLAVAGLGLILFTGHDPQLSVAHLSSTTFKLDAVTAGTTLTLFALCGLESAAVAAEKIRHPEKTIPRATVIGTVMAAAIYVLASTTVMMLIPSEQLAHSNAPFADAVSLFWGSAAAHWLALFAAISALGSLNGWILLTGELPFQMARNGLFPRALAHESKRGTPAISLCLSSALTVLMVLMNYGSSMVQVFTFLVLLSTAATLVMYLMTALALLKLLRTGAVKAGAGTAGLAVIGVLGALYALWTIAGAGFTTDSGVCGPALICWAPWHKNPVYLGLGLLALAVPVFLLMRSQRATLPSP